MRKFLIVAVALLVPLAAFAAGQQQSTEQGGEVTLRVLSYFHTGSDDYPLYSGYMDSFEEANPGVVIEHEGLESADARTKLSVEMASGNPPDVAFMVLGLAREYSEQGLLLDLAPFVQADPEWESIYTPTAISSVTFDGGMYLVPSQAHYGGLFYNPAVLAEAGFDGPARTWDELLEQARALRDVGKYAFLTSGQNFRYAWLFSQILVRTAGVENVNSLYLGDLKTSWDDPDSGFIAALERVEELVEVEAFPPDVNGLTGEVAQLLFGDGEAAYWYEGTWHVNGFENNVSTEFRDSLEWATFPTIPGATGDQTAGVGGPLLGWGVSGTIEDPAKLDYAVEFVRGIESREIATRHLRERSQPTGTRPFDDAWENVHPLLEAILGAYADIPATIYPTDVGAPSPVDNAIKRIAVPGIIAGSLTPVEAAAEVNARAIEFWGAE